VEGRVFKAVMHRRFDEGVAVALKR
jgi:hypothetical protein